MISNVYFQVSGVCFIIFLLCFYFYKKRLVSIENKFYITLIVTNIVSLILNILSTYIANINGFSTLSIIFSKLYLASVILWLIILSTYTYLISLNKSEQANKTNNLNFKKLIQKVLIIGVIIIIPIFVLSTNHLYDKNTIYITGLSIYYLYGITICTIIFWLYRYFSRVKYIRKKKSTIILFVLTVCIIAGIIEYLFPELLFMNFSMYFITFILYFGIDNPNLSIMYELELAKKQAEEAELSKNDALLKASHQIRSPLNTIVGFSQSILEGTHDNFKEDVLYIKEASNDLLDIVNNILDVDNKDKQEFNIIYNEYNVESLMKQIVILAKTKLENKKIEFKFNIDNNIPPVLYGDSIRIKQVILEVIYNAIKFTKEGYISLRVSSITIGNICRLIISVKDTGIGMSQEKLSTLFDDKEIKQEKLNQGNYDSKLATIKKIVESMNGKILIESEHREGTLVRISIDQKLIDPNQEEVEEIIEEDKKDFSGKKVLIVDDDKINLKVATRLLESYNVSVDTVSSGLECIQKVNDRNKYDLIFLDDWMPVMSGVETLKKLDKIKNFNTPVVALTANATSGMKEKYLKDGFDDYIPKPIERKELDRVIQKFL